MRLRLPTSFPIAAGVLALAAGCSRVAVETGSDSDTSAVACPVSADMPADDLTPHAEAWADSVLETMTLEQMAGQTLMPASYARADGATLRQLRSYVADCEVGGIAFHKGDTLSMRLLADSLQNIAPQPLFLAIDAENGLGMRLEGATSYPLNYKLTEATGQAMYDYGAEVGRECGAVGINMVFGPVLDVAPGPGWYMYRRSLGPDPVRVAELGLAYARGLEDMGVMPVGKHFPGHGYTRTDPHVWLPVIDREAGEFRRNDLLPFARYVEQGFPALMAAHVAVPALAGDSLPADFSPAIIGGLLRGEMQFGGLVISDAVNMGAVRSVDDGLCPPAVRALQAGVDIILAPADTREALGQILGAVRSGQLPIALLREHCRRILFYKYLNLRR